MPIAFVLVEPKVPENVGAAARALKTMGFDQLWLVNSDQHQQDPARWVAHGAGEILETVRQFASVAEVAEAADLLIGTTAKPRHGLHDWHEPDALREAIANKGSTVAQVALIFGREDRGLSNEELAHCHLLSGIPLAVSYPSLNLAQAVMLYAWELSALATATIKPAPTDARQWRSLFDRIERLLPVVGVADDIKLSGWLRERLGLVSQRDVNFLHTLVGDLEKRLCQAPSSDKHSDKNLDNNNGTA